MELSELILSYLPRLDDFSYSAYPPAFEEFGQKAEPFFEALHEGQGEACAGALISDLESRRLGLGRRQARLQAEREKKVLALFLAPSALKRGGEASAFAEQLSRLWNERYPRNRFFPGTFEKIMKGFDANLLGLPLRKTK